MKKKTSILMRQEQRAGIAFLIPSLIGTTIFIIVPIVMSLMLGFTQWNPMKGFSEMKFIGLQNYKTLFSDIRIQNAVRNNLTYTLTYVPFTIAIALLLAAILNRFVYMRTTLRMMVFLPYVSSLVSVATVWMVLLYPSANGPINSILTHVFHVTNPPKWFTSSDWALRGIIMMGIWHDLGYHVVILLANITALPKDVYEACAIDGASPIQTFFRVTVPMLAPAIFFCVTLATINSFKIFDQINIITEGGPGFSTTVLVQAVYYYAFKEFRFTYASAVAMLLFVIIFLFSNVLQWIEKKVTF
ncbi:MAG: sugar ABC transporter permease [Sphaerochaetaceae bacterium]|nr:sugar ABC transporter permease [Sphaerochaetaceae bacterium]